MCVNPIIAAVDAGGVWLGLLVVSWRRELREGLAEAGAANMSFASELSEWLVSWK